MNKIKYLKHTKNGKLFSCACCNRIYLEYKNLVFSFNEVEFNNFTEYIMSIDGLKWERENCNSPLNRKIAISISNKNVSFIVNLIELEELKDLILYNLSLQNKYSVNLLIKNLCLN